MAQKEQLQSLEMLRATMAHKLVAQCLHDSVEHRKRPAAFEDPLGRLVVARLPLVAFFTRREFKLQKCSPAAFLRAISVFFVGHKEFERSEQKGPEPALFRVSAIEIAAFQHPDEELLRKILRLIGRIPAPAQVSVQRIPVAVAQGNQSGPGFLAIRSASRDDESPSRSRKRG